VGVDVPNASVMIVEHAERFGLSQLHQLRGRVGRGSDQSYCYLVSYNQLSKEGRERLSTMVRTNNGFEIAEKDLEIRGPGDFYGTVQSGLPAFRFASLVKDQEVLHEARQFAFNIIDKDPEFQDTENQVINTKYNREYREREQYFKV